MNKSLFIAAGFALMVTLTGCPGSNPGQTPGPSPSVSATPTPEESSSTEPTPVPSTSAPISTPTPLPSGSALPTPVPGDTALTLTAATAVKQSDFSYVFTITGTNLGAIADYSYLQIESSDATLVLVRSGQSQHNGVELKEAVSVTPTSISFRWLPPNGAPTNNDLIKLNFLKNSQTVQNSTTVRLSVS